MNSEWPDFDVIPDYEPNDMSWHEWHGVVTIPLGELIDSGWVKWFDDDGTINDDWKWDYYDEVQYKRLCKKINERFFWDEIALLPPVRWKQQLIRKLNEVMPKYKPLYEMIAKGYDPLQSSNEYGKSRNIYSEFPETLLNGNSDYVSNGTDREYEIIKQGDLVEKMMEYAKNYNDVDVMVLNELESLFSALYTVSANGF